MSGGRKVALRVLSWTWPAGTPAPVERTRVVVVPAPDRWDHRALDGVIGAVLRRRPTPVNAPPAVWPATCHVGWGRPAFPGEHEGHVHLELDVAYLRFWATPSAYAVALPEMPVPAVEALLLDVATAAGLSWTPGEPAGAA